MPIDVRVVVAGQQSLDESCAPGDSAPICWRASTGSPCGCRRCAQRREDVLPLFSRLLEAHGQGRAPAIEVDFAERLCLHDWPFNVRELVLLARRLLALHGGEATLRARTISPDGSGGRGRPRAAERGRKVSGVPAPPRPMAEPVQLPALVVALRASGGNVARAAAILGISRQRAYRLMEGQAVDLEALRGEPEKAP